MSRVEKIELEPGFVAKTKLSAPYRDCAIGTKCFVNIMRSPSIPAPPLEMLQSEPSAMLLKIVNGELDLPIVCLPDVGADSDKKGSRCLVFGCALNDALYEWCVGNEAIRLAVTTFALEVVEYGLKASFEDGAPSFPKMKCKGEPVREMEVDLTESLEQIEQEPVDEPVSLQLPNSGMRNLVIEEIDPATRPRNTEPVAVPKTQVVDVFASFSFANLSEKDTREAYKRRYTVEWDRNGVQWQMLHSRPASELRLCQGGKVVLRIPVEPDVSAIKSFQLAREPKLYIYVK